MMSLVKVKLLAAFFGLWICAASWGGWTYRCDGSRYYCLCVRDRTNCPGCHSCVGMPIPNEVLLLFSNVTDCSGCIVNFSTNNLFTHFGDATVLELYVNRSIPVYLGATGFPFCVYMGEAGWCVVENWSSQDGSCSGDSSVVTNILYAGLWRAFRCNNGNPAVLVADTIGNCQTLGTVWFEGFGIKTLPCTNTVQMTNSEIFCGVTVQGVVRVGASGTVTCVAQ